MLRRIYVQTGHPCQKPPAPFMLVEMQVEPGQEIKAAKLHRKEQAGQPGNYGLAELVYKHGMIFVPSDFYYAIFDSPTDLHPFAASDNYYWRQQMQEDGS